MNLPGIAVVAGLLAIGWPVASVSTASAQSVTIDVDRDKVVVRPRFGVLNAGLFNFWVRPRVGIARVTVNIRGGSVRRSRLQKRRFDPSRRGAQHYLFNFHGLQKTTTANITATLENGQVARKRVRLILK